jgi:hypothetical protein
MLHGMVVLEVVVGGSKYSEVNKFLEIKKLAELGWGRENFIKHNY